MQEGYAQNVGILLLQNFGIYQYFLRVGLFNKILGVLYLDYYFVIFQKNWRLRLFMAVQRIAGVDHPRQPVT